MCEKGGNMRRAFQEYQYAIQFYSGGFPYDEIVEKQYAIANQLRGGLDGWMWFGGGATLDEVTDMYQIVIDNAPAGTNAPTAYLLMGLIQEAEGNFIEAATIYEALATRYPRSAEAETGLYRAALSRTALANKNPRDERMLRNAIVALRFFLQTHPDHAESETVRAHHDELVQRLATKAYDRAAFYDRIRQRPLAAHVKYQEFLRNFPDAQEAPRVRNRLAAIEQESGVRSQESGGADE